MGKDPPEIDPGTPFRIPDPLNREKLNEMVKEEKSVSVIVDQHSASEQLDTFVSSEPAQ